jgi:hypothetical protein
MKIPARANGTVRPGDTPVRRSQKVSRIVAIAQRLGRQIPEEELRRIPKDLSSQIDHYVYGTPKR